MWPNWINQLVMRWLGSSGCCLVGIAMVPRLPLHSRQWLLTSSTTPGAAGTCMPSIVPPLVGLHGGWRGGELNNFETFMSNEPPKLPRPSLLPDLRASPATPIRSSLIATQEPFQAPRGIKEATAPTTSSPQTSGSRPKSSRQGSRQLPGSVPRLRSCLEYLSLSLILNSLF